ncbi:GIN domain-containing protein [Pedobacter nutrimenti]|uniref:Putative auto-transporter adhesin head GIN domain-containing protein n=1 Tax=Pedobacter nutrimenti TaxID=1241337 RepID=A0A318UCL4_9SPHI|nr:DUF2807 domain-containing protein [Pedobacter nutrimenti]PYF72389.1 hypothetical protein B0O44_10638 [Pedobacter nutrimenti]
MKNLIKRWLTVMAAVAVFTSASLAAPVTDTLKHQQNTEIDMIILRGNVRVYLIQKIQGSMKIVTSRTAEELTVTKRGEKLLINSEQNEPVVLYIYLKNLKRIEASNTAVVRTSGNFNLKLLQVILHDGARAELNIHTEALYTQLKDQSKLHLAGSTEEHVLVRGKVSNLKMEKFSALKTDTIPYQLLLADEKLAGQVH